MEDNRPRYHRLHTRTQDRQTLLEQIRTREVWGQAPKLGGAILCVKAYRGPLPEDQLGIEFTTPIPPTPGRGTPHEALWDEGSPGVMLRRNAEGINFVAIPVTITKHRP